MLKFRHIKPLTAALMTAAILVGCNDDILPAAEAPAESCATDPGYDLQLYIQSELKTSARSARPMYSSTPGNNINEVWLRIFRKVGSNWQSANDHVNIWAMIADSISGSDVREYTTVEGNTFHYIDLTANRENRLRWHDKNVNIAFENGFRLKLAGLLPNSQYVITGTGYNTPMNYEFSFNENDPKIEAQWYPNKVVGGGNGYAEHDAETGDVKYQANINAETGIVINNVIALREEELFHGATVFTTDENANISTYKCTNQSTTTIMNSAGKPVTITRIELYRQVAGVLGYFKNIPTHIETFDEHTGTKEEIEVIAVRVVCAARSNRLLLEDNSASRQNYVGTPSFQYGYPETIFTIPIPADAEKGYTDTSNKFVYYKIWHIPARVQGADYEYSTVRNSVIGSGFWLPVPAESFINANGESFDATTFQIQLLGQPERVLRTFNVKLSNGSLSFPVNRDYFYSLGLKVGSGLGSDRPEEDIYYNPEDNEDNPIDLSKQDDIVLTVADAWDESHFFVIGAQEAAN